MGNQSISLVDENLKTKPFRGTEIEQVIAKFMPMFYTHINCIINRYKTEQFELNENQIKVIMAVNHLGEMSPVQISRDLHIFKGSLTTMIRGLMAMGMLTRREDPNDARKYYVSTTDKARQFIREKKAQEAQLFDKLFYNMPEADLKKVCEGLLILSEYLMKAENNETI